MPISNNLDHTTSCTEGASLRLQLEDVEREFQTRIEHLLRETELKIKALRLEQESKLNSVEHEYEGKVSTLRRQLESTSCGCRTTAGATTRDDRNPSSVKNRVIAGSFRLYCPLVSLYSP